MSNSSVSTADRILAYLNQKKILILGFGREGRSTYDFIRSNLPEQVLYIADQRPGFEQQNKALAQDKNSVFISGENYLENLATYDLIIKTPGISLAKIDTSGFSNKITSQLELFLEFSNYFTIGITGTKGKSTTSSLIYQVLQDQSVDSILLGNIGIPIFEHLHELRAGMKVILELSSHQLEYVHCSPNIALLLNAYEEHLDHYNSFADYIQAKCNIFKFQSPSDSFIYDADDSNLRSFIHRPTAHTYRVSPSGDTSCASYLNHDGIYFNHQLIYPRDTPRQLLGDYNLSNIMFVLTVSEILNLDLEVTKQTISEFKTLKHRLEFVTTKNGVKYYDNSIGTVSMATIEAVKALGDVDTLIIGGMDRGLDYSDFANFLNRSSIRNIICMPKTGHMIAETLLPQKVHLVNTLEEAVSLSQQLTSSGRSVLLSPTAASYGFFKNFEEKGDKFQELVHALN